MFEYVTAGALAVAVAAGGWGWIERHNAETARLKLNAVQGELQTCGARLENLIEDVRSDREIDNLPDSALRNVPPHWLRPEASLGD